MRDRFFGLYRGQVVSNLDPIQGGRLRVLVPDVFGEDEQRWAMPCSPYPDPRAGFHLPSDGANVWVAFEGGDPDAPIWVGCFWAYGVVPPEAVQSP